MTIAQITEKTQYGDYTTLSRMLGCQAMTAKMRLIRGNQQAKEAMQLIIEGREKLIQDFQSKIKKG